MRRGRLGSSELEVSALALGSWRTFERIPREAGIAVMTAARQAGIDFLDDARYDDRSGTAPIPTGYSEVVFGELFRAIGWKRDEVVVSNKLWWEFWPEQTAEQELDASLGRMGFDHVDLVYSEQPPEGLPVEDVVGAVNGLLAAGKARAWGVLSWAPEQIVEATRAAAAAGSSFPCAAQLPYGLAYTDVVEDDTMARALDGARARVVASFVLAGGALTGKYSSDAAAGRLAEQPAAERDSELWQGAYRIGERLRETADELDTTPARLAIAFALANPRVATVLFGATSPEQVADDVGAVELLEHMSDADLARLRGTRETTQP
jgi:aryl-alcohol dehydrogenase-like predicted oxidoreductase